MTSNEAPSAGGPDPGEVVRRASLGARVLTARGFGMRLVSILSNLALVAMVTPADFGLYAVVRGLSSLAGTTTDLGFAWALLRREREPSDEEYRDFVGLQLSLLVAVVLVVIVNPGLLTDIAAIPADRRSWMVGVLLTTLITPFGTTARIRIERALDYRRIAIYDVSSVLLLNVGLLCAALIGHFASGVFVVVGISTAASNLLLWYWAPGPGPAFRPAAWRRLAREFVGFSAGHLCSIVYSSGTPVLIANLFGLPVAGFWSLATRLGNILQSTFEGFRRAAVPAAARLTRSPMDMKRLVDQSFWGAARLTMPALAAIYCCLPVVGEILPHWQPAIGLAQAYVLGFGLTGVLAASVVPGAVALLGPKVILIEQLVPMSVAWTGFMFLRLIGSNALTPVIPAIFVGLAIALWVIAKEAARPSWRPEHSRLALGLLIVLGLGIGGGALQAEPRLIAVMSGAAFLAAWKLPRPGAPHAVGARGGVTEVD